MQKMANKDANSKERHYVYLVRCADDSLYCGWTTNLKRRMEAHNGMFQAVLNIREGDVLLRWYILKAFTINRTHNVENMP